MTIHSHIEFDRSYNSNQYPDNTSKRFHLKGIEAAADYLKKKRRFKLKK